MYHINVTLMPVGVNDVAIMMDGVKQDSKILVLINDGQEHQVEVQIASDDSCGESLSEAGMISSAN